MKMISPRHRCEEKYFQLMFPRHMFDCDANGQVEDTKNEHYRECLARGEVGRVQQFHRSWMEPAVGECACGNKLSLEDPMTNVCECGAYYNGCGQRLNHPSMWEESY